MLKSEITDVLKEGIYSFSYEKTDGTIREATGTLLPSALPVNDKPASGNARAPNPNTVIYYDVDLKEFRSFVVEKFIGFK